MEWLQTLIGAAFAAGGAYAAVRVHLYYLRRDIDRIEERVDGLEQRERGYGSLA